MKSSSLLKLRKTVLDFYSKNGRDDLPWRKTTNPYKIFISEIMLQQTQVERVISFYKEWMKVFPTVKVLSEAPLSLVLKQWQGLGYNRRAKNLHEAAKKIRDMGKFPTSVEELEALPGVGPYTARAVLAFAYNQDVVMIETNIRTVVIHHLFEGSKDKVTDKEILALLTKLLPKGKSREWYYALMDYGSYLKRTGVRTNTKVKGYKKQNTFKGSSREARGALLKELAKATTGEARLLGLLGDDRLDQVRLQLEALVKEGMVEKIGRNYQLPK